MFGHVIQVWILYYRSKKGEKSEQLAIDEEEMNTLKSSNVN